jgi:hypothetical protein
MTTLGRKRSFGSNCLWPDAIIRSNAAISAILYRFSIGLVARTGRAPVAKVRFGTDLQLIAPTLVNWRQQTGLY